MLNFFRRKRFKKPLQNWQIPLDPNYQRIINVDSVQLVNEDQSIILYFSILKVTGNSILPVDILAKIQPSVTRLENGWELKGTRSGGEEILVCVFFYTNEGDESAMKDLFTNIVYTGK
jgi:hypothetical protein